MDEITRETRPESGLSRVKTRSQETLQSTYNRFEAAGISSIPSERSSRIVPQDSVSSRAFRPDSTNSHRSPFTADESVPPSRGGAMPRSDSGLSSHRNVESPFRWPNERRITSPAPFQASTSAFHLPALGGQTYFRSRRVQDISTITKPWTEVKDPKKKWHSIIPWIGIFIGVAATGALCFQGYNSVINHDYCLVMSDDFSSPTLNTDIWTKEVQSGGFGNGQFDVTTGGDENVFIKNGELWIKPTLQDQKLMETDNVIDLRKDGSCTSNTWENCYSFTNTTNGTVVNPAKSGRINSKKGGVIQFGRVEVEALFPDGDWMWPAIWMLPVEPTYGDWPASGEIDLAESRGNNYTYPLGGSDTISAALHWGPMPSLDSWFRTFIKRQALHTTFSKTWHKFGVEWSEKYIFTYVDRRLLQALYVPFDKPRWPEGHFDASGQNGTKLVDPWSQTGRPSTPFDQPFFLILNVAVGSRNGWWQDGVAAKPWVDTSDYAKRDFWLARNQWYPTWQDNGQMRVRSVKMWQQAGYRGCVGK